MLFAKNESKIQQIYVYIYIYIFCYSIGIYLFQKFLIYLKQIHLTGLFGIPVLIDH